MHQSFKDYIAWCNEKNLKAGYFETLKKYVEEVGQC